MGKILVKALQVLICAVLIFQLAGCGTLMYSEGQGERNYYRDGRWYRHDPRGHEIAVEVLDNGALIESLPPQHTTVIIEGASYYHDDRYYYRPAPRGGYTVVQPPVRVPPQSQNNHEQRKDKGGNGHNEENRGEGH